MLPELLGGSADLTGSNLTNWKAAKPVRVNEEGRAAGNYVNYGVREFGMSAAINGLALHGGFKAFGGTFLTFSDYSRNALRVAALMKAPSIFVFTHDSIGLGEDGPTHQSVEHVASLRLIPHLQVWRPSDTVETAVAWTQAVEHNGPSCLIFSRQNLPFSERTDAQIANIEKRRLCAARLERRDRRAQNHPDRDGFGSGTGAERGRAAGARRHRGARSCRCRRPPCSTSRTPSTANACCRKACAASRSKRA